MKIDEKAIKQLADLLNETGLTEIEVAEGETLIRVNKGGTVIQGGGATLAPAMPSDPTVPQAANTDTTPAAASTHPGAVTSPMVGTAYLQAEPGNPPFVSKGSSVAAGDTLMIVEAMKVMNPIKAPKAGTVTQVSVENGQPVEFGDVLVVIE